MLSPAAKVECIGRRLISLTAGSCHSRPVWAEAANAPESAAARIKRVFFIGYGYGFDFAVSFRVQSTKLISQRTQSNSSR